MSAPLPVQVIEQTAQAAAVLTPMRLDLLRRLATPASASALARELEVPRQKLNYHLKALQSVGLVRQVAKKKRGNCIEVILQASASSYVVGPSALLGVAPDQRPVQDRFSWAYLVSVCSRTIRELGVLRRGADKEAKTLATLSMETEVRFASPADRTAFAHELATAFAEISARYHSPDAENGRSFRAFLGAHPHLPASDDVDSPEEP